MRWYTNSSGQPKIHVRTGKIFVTTGKILKTGKILFTTGKILHIAGSRPILTWQSFTERAEYFTGRVEDLIFYWSNGGFNILLVEWRISVVVTRSLSIVLKLLLLGTCCLGCRVKFALVRHHTFTPTCNMFQRWDALAVGSVAMELPGPRIRILVGG